MVNGMDMNRQSRLVLRWVAAVVAVMAMMYAGRCDYNEEVYSEMGYETYQEIKKELGPCASESEIVDEYMRNRDYWKGCR